MYALSITHSYVPNAYGSIQLDADATKYLIALSNSDGPPPHEFTFGRVTRDNGDVFVRFTRYSNTLSVLEKISNEFQNPSSNLYARHAWALENNVEITYTITEVDGPIDDPVPPPDDPLASIPE